MGTGRSQTDTVDIRGRKKRFADDFYVSPQWKRCARGYRKSVGGLCEWCKKKGIIKPAEEVHHIIRLTPENINKPEITLNWANLAALCKDCHKKIKKKEQRWTVDEDGYVTPKDPP